jgi:OOP family OmpA-OmpF porin
MLKQSGHQLLLGLTISALLAVNPAMAASETARAYLIDSEGNPVLSATDNCVVTPNQPGSAGFVQCGDGGNDADGDGVTDDKDKCPDTPKGVKVDADGCPIDSDGDGVPDYKDKCPNNTAAELVAGVDANGCPKDSDGDGVADYKDKCPNTPLNTQVDEYGCPLLDTYKMVIDSNSGQVKFGFDKADLTATGKKALDELVGFVKGDVERVQSVEVVGHTDSTGPSKYNQGLSERRAKAVANYLISAGMPSDKLSSSGKGEDQPAASNATSTGRAQNRRVEIITKKTKKVKAD